MNPLHHRFNPIDNKMKTKMMKKQKMTSTKPWFETQKPISGHPKMKRENVEEGTPSFGFIIRSGFTEMDEIIILQCMIEYAKSKHVPLPLANLRYFYPFLKGKLSADFTNSQIYDKIRRLKYRYLNRLKKECGGAPVLTFSSDYDFEVYTISKNIWVVDSDDDGHDEEDGEQVFCSKYPLLMESLEWENSSTFSKLDTVKENLHLIGSAKASKLEMEWMELKSKESEIHSRKVNFKMELIRTVLNATKDE